MIKRVKLGRWRFTFTVAKVTKVIGVNSTLADGKHILMWDFDDTTLNDVAVALRAVQYHYQLPDIAIVCTKEPLNYVAYCFARCDWLEALKIVCDTEGVDHNFIKYSAYREHFTLRVTPKLVEVPHFKYAIRGYRKGECSDNDLRSWVRYETLQE